MSQLAVAGLGQPCVELILDGHHQPCRQDAEVADSPTIANVALLERIYGPLERGESHDFEPFFDVLADDVFLETSVMEIHGKEALINYLVVASELMDFQPFERPLQYVAGGTRVVQLGQETFRVKKSGATHRAERR
jgi:hypothetical protein